MSYGQSKIRKHCYRSKIAPRKQTNVDFFSIPKAYFAFKWQALRLQHMLRGSASEETFENADEALTLKVSRMLPRLRTRATNV